jgi:mannose-6-phosphate isomerase-like protein (cupin superfamily)
MTPRKIDLESLREAWSRRGYSCEVWIDPPGQVWHDFVHDVDELVQLVEGTCQIEMNERCLRLEAGDELLIPAHTRHTVRNCGEGPARWLHGFRIGDTEAAAS